MTAKTFDSVKLMRELRTKISMEMEPMTPKERIRYIQDKAASTAIGRALTAQADDAARQAGAADRRVAGR